ncbi:MAG: ASKHA domain-containing protein [Desulfarculales bacterium]|nr:ASKHA domain-containing protein [Desulfarculales bacterium]
MRFLPDEIKAEVAPGVTLLSAARRAGAALESPCDGMGVCGKCLVELTSGDCADIAADAAKASVLQPPVRVLACRTVVGELDAQVRIARSAAGLQVHDEGDSVACAIMPRMLKRYDAVSGATEILADGRHLGWETGDTGKALFGLAADIGTTTLTVAVINLNDGRELASFSGLNPQTRYAQDVLGRIHFASEKAGLEILNREVVSAINQLAGLACAQAGVEIAHIYETVLSGNTCMAHLAAGLNPEALGRYPFSPEFSGHVSLPSRPLGLWGAEFGETYFPPVISGYIGADITAGIIAADLARRPGVTLLVDIGTNGEIVLARDGEMFAASAAAGPAFEGMNISCGMRAAAGAIEYYRLRDDGSAVIKTVAGAPAQGICGSGLMDAVAELVRKGGVSPNGRFNATGGELAARMERDNGKTRFRLIGEVFLTQKDIRQVQLAKAAVRAGIELLLTQAGLRADEVEQVFVAGSFGYHLRERSLLDLGLLPPQLAGRVRFAGNTAKSGARIFLLNQPSRGAAQSIAGRVHCCDLAGDPQFQEVFIAAMAFPSK